MASAPKRYFAGKPPVTESDSDSEEKPSVENKTKQRQQEQQQQPAQRRRRRIVARVVPTPPAHDNEPLVQKKGSAAGFVPVNVSNAGESEQRSGSVEENANSYSEDSSDEEASSSSSSSEEEEEVEEKVGILKSPVFIPLTKARMKEESEDRLIHEEKQKKREMNRIQERRKETERLVKIIREEEEQKDGREEVGEQNVPVHDDEVEQMEEQIGLWRLREEMRRERDEKMRQRWKERKVKEEEKEREETDEVEKGKKGSKIGPFFMDTNQDGSFKEEIYNRDYGKSSIKES